MFPNFPFPLPLEWSRSPLAVSPSPSLPFHPLSAINPVRSAARWLPPPSFTICRQQLSRLSILLAVTFHLSSCRFPHIYEVNKISIGHGPLLELCNLYYENLHNLGVAMAHYVKKGIEPEWRQSHVSKSIRVMLNESDDAQTHP